MAVSTSFFLCYTDKYIREKKLDSTPITVRCELRYTLDALPWALSRRVGGQERRVKFNLPVKVAPRHWRAGRARPTDPDALTVNTLIEQISARAQALHAGYVAAGEFPPVGEFVTTLIGAGQGVEKSFYADYAAYIDYLTNSRKSRPFVNQQRLVRDTLLRFERATGHRVDYATINRNFYQ